MSDTITAAFRRVLFGIKWVERLRYQVHTIFVGELLVQDVALKKRQESLDYLKVAIEAPLDEAQVFRRGDAH